MHCDVQEYRSCSNSADKQSSHIGGPGPLVVGVSETGSLTGALVADSLAGRCLNYGFIVTQKRLKPPAGHRCNL